MGLVALAIATLCYLFAAVDLCFAQKNRLMAGVFAAYALANVFLILASYRQTLVALIAKLQ
jgi:hypothetical protein